MAGGHFSTAATKPPSSAKQASQMVAQPANQPQAQAQAQQAQQAQQPQSQTQQGGSAAVPPGPAKVVGPNVKGNREEYQLLRRLQSALFGGVYEARGLSSGKDFAIKVLHKTELSKAQENSSIEFCEVPLSEIRFAELMRGNEHVMEVEEQFEDLYCFYVVFELARGGDLLEALKEKRNGFDELQAQTFIRQATKGLAYLHKRRVAMQDVSLENMLLHVDEQTGQFMVKVCDPGQAAIFEVLENGEELPVDFRGLVGKSFRPPELHQQKSYHATKVDSWCLGWSTFYLLTAQPLFFSADPAQLDQDWILFEKGDYKTLFTQKSNLCSHTGLDFIFRLMQLEPGRRMSVTDALDHAWLTDPKICPVLAPKELLPEARSKKEDDVAAEVEEAEYIAVTHQTFSGHPDQDATGGSMKQPPGVTPAGPPSQKPAVVSPGGITWPPAVSNAAHPMGNADLPTWATAAAGPVPGSMLRVVSPMRSPRTTGAPASGQQPRLAVDRRSRGRMAMQGSAARLPYVVATAHSPAPVGATPVSPMHRTGSSAIRAVSPMQGQVMLQTQMRPAMSQQQLSAKPPEGFSQPAFMTPRMASRPRSPDPSTQGEASAPGNPMPPTAVVSGGDVRQPAWAFRAERQGSDDGSPAPPVDMHARTIRTSSPVVGRASSPQLTMQGSRSIQQGMTANFQPQGRFVQSPTRNQGQMYHMPRSLSPVQVQQVQVGRPQQIRTASPTNAAPRASGGGFSWTQVPASFSPRENSPIGSGAIRTASPMTTVTPAMGFSFKPDPPSPRLPSRTFSPGQVPSSGCSGAITFPKAGVNSPAPAGAPRGQVVMRR